MTDDRSERLRKRRKRSTDTAPDHQPSDGGETAQLGGPDQSSKPSESSKPNGGNGDQTLSVKEDRTGTYMYLPDPQTRELSRLYNILKAEYQVEYNDDFEKNRHFYPLVIQHGLDSLESMDASDLRRHLDQLAHESDLD